MSRLFLTALLAAVSPFVCSAQSPAGAPAAGATKLTAAASPSAAPAAPIASSSAEPKITYSSCHVDGPYIAMTFDDGPSGANTPRLLDMLKQRGIKATFFMVGENAAEYPQIVKRIVAEGHEVGNHSWSHPDFAKMSDAAVRDQLQKTHDAIVAGGGVAPKLMRPPYGAFTARQRRWCNGEFGYKIILWDVDPLDWKIRNAAHVESEILKHTGSGSIILSHDIHKTTVDAMPSTLDQLLAKGFKFVTVSQLIAMDKPSGAKPKAEPKAYTAPANEPPLAPTGSAAAKPATPAVTPAAPAAPASPAPAPAAR